MQVKKIPLRTCVGCHAEKPKKELIRIVKNKEGQMFVDTTGKLNGRGAYICGDKACTEKIIKKKTLNHVFEMEVPNEIYEQLKETVIGK